MKMPLGRWVSDVRDMPSRRRSLHRRLGRVVRVAPSRVEILVRSRRYRVCPETFERDKTFMRSHSSAGTACYSFAFTSPRPCSSPPPVGPRAADSRRTTGEVATSSLARRNSDPETLRETSLGSWMLTDDWDTIYPELPSVATVLGTDFDLCLSYWVLAYPVLLPSPMVTVAMSSLQVSE
ncbi:hypothetical protein K466DRAFT_31006 [Polyporus arcularius HHB13444]|uniref:Uncharacterized protein n=1 Tax=Polyporus arcularius HHB13444 TaxID=1314778 RepID=A0A5C3NQ98_9APHY|nr:hypothetical protein K466DRAFT_31006 [Polyporus arcularius HHB13444]